VGVLGGGGEVGCGVYIDISTHVKLFSHYSHTPSIGLCQKWGQDWC